MIWAMNFQHTGAHHVAILPDFQSIKILRYAYRSFLARTTTWIQRAAHSGKKGDRKHIDRSSCGFLGEEEARNTLTGSWLFSEQLLFVKSMMKNKRETVEVFIPHLVL